MLYNRKTPDKVCVSHMKHVGENNTVFTTQAVRRRATHWFNFKKFKSLIRWHIDEQLLF